MILSSDSFPVAKPLSRFFVLEIACQARLYGTLHFAAIGWVGMGDRFWKDNFYERNHFAIRLFLGFGADA